MNRYELDKHIVDTYGAKGEFLWEKYPTFAVYRHKSNKKWFAVIMEIPKSKLELGESGTVQVVNLKCDPLLIGSILSENGIHKGYHMNKNHWITLRLDGSLDADKCRWLLEISFGLTSPKTKKRGN